ncbi:chemotaxis protein CheV [Geovibrio ferrireducens]|jgi:two-component system chemotaxis response regulator CheV|uniref:chemotaxis protein CheV n=1 Tax=Geovibrio ferrireducens TaxID=46201 RepID=UPI0022475DC4|nr:chemotaxis protein CheV [Geovibrio ferrireducens]
MALDHGILLETGTNEFEIVEFIVRAEKEHHFGINVAKVREVIRFPEIVKVPDAHPAVIGTANIRQKLVPLIDLGSWLDLKFEQDYAAKKIIVTFFNHQYNGFLVDEVVRIHRITWADIKDYSAITDFSLAETVLGVVDIGGNLIQLLDFEKIVSELNPATALKEMVIDYSRSAARSKKLVYLAEDSTVIRRFLAINLENAGYRVKAFENGKLLLAATAIETPDIIITDLEMPVADGAFVVRTLRGKPELAKLPILVFSSLASEENERKVLSIGANMFVGKPDTDILINSIDEYVL